MADERIKWIDAAKGLGIILVVFTHHRLPQLAVTYLWPFVTPIFFIVSGYLFGMKKPADFMKFLRKRTRTLLVPYAVFMLVLYTYFLTIGSRYGESGQMPLTTPIVGLFYSSADYLRGVFTPIWFLPCLFVVEIMFFWMFRLFRKWYGLAVLACSVLGFVGSVYLFNGDQSTIRHAVEFSVLGLHGTLWIPFRLPWGIDIAFIAVAFYGAGCAIRGLRSPGKSNLWWLLPIPILLAINIVASFTNGPVTIRSNSYSNYFLYYISAFAGAFGYILIARLTQWFTPFIYLGKNSFAIFALHVMFIGVIKGFMRIVLKYPAQNLETSLAWGIFFTIACLFLLVPAIYIINTYFPFILGRSKPRDLVVKAAAP